ncbi:MAG: hypothetical protein WAM60_17830 [Candidatus Promineifilaceae bacterium]
MRRLRRKIRRRLFQRGFANSVFTMEGTLHQLQDYLGEMSDGRTGACAFTWGYYGTFENLPAFTDVPAEWQSRYMEYRSILNETRIVMIPMVDACIEYNTPTFTLPQSTIQSMLPTVANLRVRVETLAANV